MINYSIIKELLKYDLTDEQILEKLQSDECTKETIAIPIAFLKEMIKLEKKVYKKEKNKIYHNNNKNSYKVSSRKAIIKKYGITLKEYTKLFNKQKGKCPICGKHQNELKQSLCIDHDHKTNNVRGLLCSKCNLILGNANENVQVLADAINYLNIHNVL